LSPNYFEVPTFKGLAIHTWERTWQYIKKAGTVILGISVILWAMMTFPGPPESVSKKFEHQRQSLAVKSIDNKTETIVTSENKPDLEALQKKIQVAEAEAGLKYSLAGRIGTAMETISLWAGFDWRTNIALLGGFAAKEVVVSTLGTAYSLGEIDAEENRSLSNRLANSPGWSPLVGLSLIVFTMFYAPCFVSVVCISKEAGSWKWGAFSILFNTMLAFTLSVLIFQIGTAMGF